MSKVNAQAQTIGGFAVVGLTAKTCNKDGQATQDINALWQRFFDLAVGEAIPHKDGEAIYAVYHSYEGDHEQPYHLTVGCRVTEETDLPEGLSSVFVPEADYAVFSAQGDQPQALLNTWEAIWKSNIERAYGCDVEVYGPRFFEPGVHEVLVCVGVKQ